MPTEAEVEQERATKKTIAFLDIPTCRPVYETDNRVFRFPCGMVVTETFAFREVVAFELGYAMRDVHEEHHEQGHNQDFWYLMEHRDTGPRWCRFEFSCSCEGR